MARRKVPNVDNETCPELGAAIESRMVEFGLSPGDLQELTGLTGAGLANVRNGLRHRYQVRTTQAVTHVLGWSPDSIERLLDGGAPIVVSDQPRRYQPPGDRSLRAEAAEAQLPVSRAEVVRLATLVSQMLGELGANRKRIDAMVAQLAHPTDTESSAAAS